MPSATTATNQIMKAAIAYGSSRSASVNASPVVSTSGGVATVSQLNLGNRPDLTRGYPIYLRALRFWPRALSNAELISVTT